MIGGQTDNINGYCTTEKTFFTLLLLFLSFQLSAQNKLERPDRALVDKEVLAQCEREVEKIRRMQLKCDTLMHGVLDVPAEFYFDKQGRLRMWVYHYNWESENGTSAAYYDGNGQLIYIEEAGGTNCDEGEEYFYLHDGRIVDYGFYYSCECCEEDEQEEVEAKLPVVGDLYIDTREDGKYYITTEYVFYTSISRIVNGLGISQFSDFPKLPDTIPQMKAADIRYCQSLQSLPRYFMRDSIDHPKAYILQYFNEANTAIAIEKDNQYLVFSIIPPNEYNEYEIVRENIDGVGSDELIIYLKYSKEYMDTDYEQASQECGVVVWNLDTYECLLNLYLSDQSLYWIYDTSGKKILKESSCIGYEMDLNNKQLSIQRFISGENVSLENKQPANRKIKGCEGCEEVWLEQKHIYKLTESGYVLEKVE